jgi:hypothetical protein
MSHARTTAGRGAMLLLLILLATGILRIYHLRLSRGDAYPNHSSLRADPMGTRLLFDAIKDAGIAIPQRNFTPLDKLESPEAPTTLLLIGTEMAAVPDTDWTPRHTATRLSRFAARGGHIVITLTPSYLRARHNHTNQLCEATNTVEQAASSTASSTNELDDAKAEFTPTCPSCGKDHDEDNESANNVDTAVWIGVATRDDRRPATTTTARRTASAPSHLPDTLPCRTDAVLDKLSPEWEVIYTRNDMPVLARRSYGKGSFTISTLSYFLTNQAMRDDRRTDALIWLFNDAERVIFDETHLGLTSQKLTAELLKQHRLQWTLIIAAIAGLLFAWRAGSSLLPKQHTHITDQLTDATQTTHTSLLALLRRHLPKRQLLSCLVEQWETHGDGSSPPCEALLRQAQREAKNHASAKISKGKKIVDAYNQLVRQAQAARHGLHHQSIAPDESNPDIDKKKTPEPLTPNT